MVMTTWIFFFFNDTATTEIYTLSLHDALPISPRPARGRGAPGGDAHAPRRRFSVDGGRQHGLDGGPGDPRRPRLRPPRSEEHTSELQSRQYLVCRLLLEKKKNQRAHVY